MSPAEFRECEGASRSKGHGSVRTEERKIRVAVSSRLAGLRRQREHQTGGPPRGPPLEVPAREAGHRLEVGPRCTAMRPRRLTADRNPERGVLPTPDPSPYPMRTSRAGTPSYWRRGCQPSRPTGAIGRTDSSSLILDERKPEPVAFADGGEMNPCSRGSSKACRHPAVRPVQADNGPAISSRRDSGVRVCRGCPIS